MATKSLKAAGHQLAQTQKQLDLLQSGPFKDGDLPLFKDKIAQSGQFPLKAKKLEILQINLGYMCNQVCAHCHVDAGPDRKEIMTRETMQQCLDVIAQTGAHTLDLTGGARCLFRIDGAELRSRGCAAIELTRAEPLRPGTVGHHSGAEFIACG